MTTEEQNPTLDELDKALIKAIRRANTVLNEVPQHCQPYYYPFLVDFELKGLGFSIPQPHSFTVAQPASQPVPSTQAPTSDGVTQRLPSNLSVNEFIKRVGVESHAARFVAIGYYLMHTGKSEQFSVADVLDAYNRLRIPKPKNPADVINQAIRKVHIVDAPPSPDRPKSWMITPTGEEFIEEQLNQNSGAAK